MTNIVTSDRSFSPDQHQLLELLSDMMIPAVGEMPSAADREIFLRIETSLAEHLDVVIKAIGDLEAAALARGQTSFRDLDRASRLEVAATFRQTNPVFISILQSCVVASYYQDDRVLRGLGLPDRAPFPQGNAVDETDWSLLDPVRQRDPFFRVVDGEGI
jgi:hypothetical protein